MSKPQGLKGELLLSPLNPQAEWPKNIRSIKIGTQSFVVEELRPHKIKSHKKSFVIKLKDCDSKQQAEGLKQQPVYLKKSLFRAKPASPSIYLAELIGFSVIFEGQTQTAVVAYFESQAKSFDFLVLLFKNARGKKAYQCSIPFIPEYIKKIDKKNKQIHLKLPVDFLETFKETVKT